MQTVDSSAPTAYTPAMDIALLVPLTPSLDDYPFLDDLHATIVAAANAASAAIHALGVTSHRGLREQLLPLLVAPPHQLLYQTAFLLIGPVAALYRTPPWPRRPIVVASFAMPVDARTATLHDSPPTIRTWTPSGQHSFPLSLTLLQRGVWAYRSSAGQLLLHRSGYFYNTVCTVPQDMVPEQVYASPLALV